LLGEGFPNVIGEAMAYGVAYGVPCVVTDVGDSALIVGETGRVVPPRDPRALAAAWRDMLQMDRETRGGLGERAHARIVTHFSLNEIARQHEKRYTEIVNGPT